MMECVSPQEIPIATRTSHTNVFNLSQNVYECDAFNEEDGEEKTAFIQLAWLAFEVQTKPVKMEFHIYELQHLQMRAGDVD